MLHALSDRPQVEQQSPASLARGEDPARDLGDLSIKAQLRDFLELRALDGDTSAMNALRFVDKADAAIARCRALECSPKNCLYLCGRKRW